VYDTCVILEGSTRKIINRPQMQPPLPSPSPPPTWGVIEELKGNVWVWQRWLAMAGGSRGGQQRRRRQWRGRLSFCIFMKTELGRVRGGRQEAKYPTRKACIRRKLVLLHWEKKCSNPQKYLQQKSLQGYLAERLANAYRIKRIGNFFCPICLYRSAYVLPKRCRCTYVRGLGKIYCSLESGYILVGTYIISD
jgi:hypothetical protein